MSDNLNIFGSKISIILLLVFVIFVYIIMFSILHKNNESSSGWVLIIEVVLWITLIIIIVVNIKWLNDKHFNFNVELNNLFDEKLTELNIFAMDEQDNKDKNNKKNKKDTYDISFNKDISSCTLNEDDGEVFHIESNIYSYDEAKGVCNLFNSRLATYDEVEKAYQNGANWCSYGWSDDQLALFPIQKSLYNDLKKIPGHENDCGRQGVNGGFIEDKSTTFGINCYGQKPYMTDKDKNFMKNYTNTPTLSVEEQDKLNKKIQDILVAPFNKDKWNYK